MMYMMYIMHIMRGGRDGADWKRADRCASPTLALKNLHPRQFFTTL